MKIMAAFMGILMLLLGTIFAIGQGCSAMYSGNGGGYGGMQPPINEGTYDGSDRSSSSETSGDPTFPGYYHFSQTPICPTATAFGGLSAFVDSNVYISPTLYTWRYRADFCTSPVSISTNSVSRVNFDPNVAIYNNRALSHYSVAPATSADLKFSQAYCTQLDAPNSFSIDTGISVYVYLQNGVTFMVVYRGVQAGDQFYRYRLGPFEVSEQTLSGRIHYSTSGVDLSLPPTAPAISTGRLNLLWQGSYLELDMNCWQE